MAGQVGDYMATPVKNTAERRSLEPAFHVARFRRNDGLAEDLAARQIRIQVDVGGQDEVLVVILGTVAKQYQVSGRSDLIRVLGRSRTTLVLGMGRPNQEKRRQDQK